MHMWRSRNCLASLHMLIRQWRCGSVDGLEAFQRIEIFSLSTPLTFSGSINLFYLSHDNKNVPRYHLHFVPDILRNGTCKLLQSASRKYCAFWPIVYSCPQVELCEVCFLLLYYTVSVSSTRLVRLVLTISIVEWSKTKRHMVPLSSFYDTTVARNVSI